ncbi:hypothetical protein EJ03DRAFT_329738 [Teratosphaeria nubilosa]|uniref:Tat pathway signal sequence n=1 Tax=Teratosphaeria nubilosa TaxID=161662 RepID=A0A6G1L3N4_9PEZI|nr:hypothetical protein EJ03DRAFT_329738 [Teratosphaeria nubilosa]
MFSSYPRYVPLKEDDESTGSDSSIEKSAFRLPQPTICIIASISLLLNLVFAAIVIHLGLTRGRCPATAVSPPQLFSPVQDAISYQLTTFESGFHGSPFMGSPTAEVDRNWKQLYGVGNSRLSRGEARHLPNKTIEAIAGEGDYLVVISVFHDLHCLDRLRQSTWYFYDEQWNETYNPFTISRPETYSRDGLNGIIHLDHCINILRQSLQCSSDVTPYVFQWDEKSQEVRAFANVVHTCRNFDSIHDWASQRTYTDIWGREGQRDEQGHCRSGDSVECLN